jgi:predicted membrane protein
MEIKSSKIFGIRAIIEVINSDATLQKVYLQDNLTSVLSGLIKKNYQVKLVVFFCATFS